MSGAGAIWEVHAFSQRFIDEAEEALSKTLETDEDGVDDVEARAVLTRAMNAAKVLRGYLGVTYEFGGNGQAELKEAEL